MDPDTASGSSHYEHNDGQEAPERKAKTAAEIRKSNKPLMEKRRRERINQCLDQLKSILMEVTKKESSYYSKLEKADILEMTVKYLKNAKRQQLGASMTSDPAVISKYIAGYNECTTEITKYLDQVEGLNPEVRARMLNHLANNLQQPNQTAPNSVTSALPYVIPQQTFQNQATPVQIPQATQLASLPGGNLQIAIPGDNNGSGGLCIINPQQQQQQQHQAQPGGVQTISASPMQLTPAKLPTGEVVFLLTNTQSVSLTGSNIGIPIMPNAQQMTIQQPNVVQQPGNINILPTATINANNVQQPIIVVSSQSTTPSAISSPPLVSSSAVKAEASSSSGDSPSTSFASPNFISPKFSSSSSLSPDDQNQSRQSKDTPLDLSPETSGNSSRTVSSTYHSQYPRSVNHPIPIDHAPNAHSTPIKGFGGNQGQYSRVLERISPDEYATYSHPGTSGSTRKSPIDVQPMHRYIPDSRSGTAFAPYERDSSSTAPRRSPIESPQQMFHAERYREFLLERELRQADRSAPDPERLHLDRQNNNMQDDDMWRPW